MAETAQSLASLAAGAGFTGGQVPIAVAIAIAESGGNPAAMGDHGTSYGLWQIHLPAHPEFKGQNLLDPATNARAAHVVYQHQGWGAWSTYNGAAYFKALPAAQAAAGGVTLDSAGIIDPAGAARSAGEAVTGAVDGTVAAAQAVTKQAAAVAGFAEQLADPNTWIRGLKVAVGAVVILIGVSLIVKLAADQSGASRAVAPIAKAAKKAAVAAAA